MKAILDYVRQHHLDDIVVTQTGCNGMCEHEPIVDVRVKGGARVTYGKMGAERVNQLMEQHVVKGSPVNEWVLKSEEAAAS